MYVVQDYDIIVGTVVIPAGQTRAVFAINITNDNVVEDTECFSVTIEIISGNFAQIDTGGESATIIIEDHDGMVIVVSIAIIFP